MNTQITIQNVDDVMADWLLAEAQRRNVSIEALSLDLLRQVIERENKLQERRRRFRELERQHEEGYRRLPVQPGEFDIWEAEQVWEEENDESR